MAGKRGRPPKSKLATPEQDEKVIELLNCTCCGANKRSSDFYMSNSVVYRAKNICQVCKDCVFELAKELIAESEDIQLGIFRTCRYLDMPYLESVFYSAKTEVEAEDALEELDGVKVFRRYVKNINSLKQYKGLTFENGEMIDKETIEKNKEQMYEDSLTDRDKQNRSDVLRILGYDPFESENAMDKKYLFNRLVDMLDESTLEDNVKLMSTIEIVKGFNQIDKINEVIAKITQDLGKIASNNGGLKTLIDTKKNLMSTVLKIAEDNGISTKFNTNKSKGSGTLSGMIKRLNEIGLDEIKVNLYDIQTAKGMEQVAEISHKSIMKQLQFDENDYADMVALQKSELEKLRKEKEKYEEELRLLKKSLKK